MKRLLVGLAVVVLSLGVAGCKRSTGDKVVLKYANFPPADTFPCVQMERWKTEVEKRTNGKVQVKTFPGGTLVDAKNIVDAVQNGTADIGCFAMSYQPGRFPISEAVDLPLGFTSSKVASLTLFDLIQKHNPKEFENVKLVTLFTCPPVNVMTAKPVKMLDDLKGMRLRAAGTAVEPLTILGAAPQGMPQSETPDALQKGTVTGVASSLEVLKDMNFAAYCKYSTRTNINVVTFAVVMNKKRWEALPDDVKQTINSLAREQAAWTGDYVDGHVKEAIEWAKQKHGHEVFDLSAADQKAVRDKLQPIIDKYIDRVTKAGLNGRQIVDDVLAIKLRVEKEAK